MKDGPAFQLYAADFYMDTISWTNEEIGIYLRLLLSEWINGPLDFNARKLASISQISLRKFGIKWVKIGEKFTENKDGKLINERLEEVREKQRLWREKSSLGGKKSAEQRTRVVQPPYQPNGQPKGNSSSSSSLKYLKKDTLLFNQFWKAYPLKKSKGQAEKTWKKINPNQDLLNAILTGIEKAKKSEQWMKNNGEFIPHPSTWLNAKGWEDEYLEILRDEPGRMKCKECGDSGQYISIGEDGLCAMCRVHLS